VHYIDSCEICYNAKFVNLQFRNKAVLYVKKYDFIYEIILKIFDLRRIYQTDCPAIKIQCENCAQMRNSALFVAAIHCAESAFILLLVTTTVVRCLLNHIVVERRLSLTSAMT